MNPTRSDFLKKVKLIRSDPNPTWPDLPDPDTTRFLSKNQTYLTRLIPTEPDSTRPIATSIWEGLIEKRDEGKLIYQYNESLFLTREQEAKSWSTLIIPDSGTVVLNLR
jgi:hypothetical protein